MNSCNKGLGDSPLPEFYSNILLGYGRGCPAEFTQLLGLPPWGKRLMNVWQTRYINTGRLASTTHRCLVARITRLIHNQSNKLSNSVIYRMALCGHFQQMKDLAPLEKLGEKSRSVPYHSAWLFPRGNDWLNLRFGATALHFSSKHHFAIGLALYTHCFE